MSSSSSSVKALLNQEQFELIRGVFESWREEALAAVDKSQFADIFGGNQQQIAIGHKFLKAVQDLQAAQLKPEPKLIHLHKYALDSDDPAAEEAQARPVLVMDAADLTQLLNACCAFGLATRDHSEPTIRSFDALEAGAEYWPEFCKH
eukprot:TRINITY_DN3925_c0_g2_i1.p1 TRINITY_DN3925_c0_g2~~TRINITY_DN3925_c0_g2_i1.p1  ORF type:complete len:148 (-),score=45.21 TRINITY_DN3925_c0_g2_i1:784-1227(-)